MSKENIKVITQKEELYEHCENIEQLFDKFYIPLLNIHYKKTYDLQQKVEEKNKEIDRLNNIINELEKDIKNLYTYGIKNNAEQRDYLLNRLEGLKALKENNKE